MNFFKEINRLEVKYDTPSTRNCYNELLTLFTDYLKALETQLVKQSKQQAQKSLVEQMKDTGSVNFGPNDSFVRKHWPDAVAQIEAGIKQHIAKA
jgi:hypothetical protein